MNKFDADAIEKFANDVQQALILINNKLIELETKINYIEKRDKK